MDENDLEPKATEAEPFNQEPLLEEPTTPEPTTPEPDEIPDVWVLHLCLWRKENKDTDDEQFDLQEEDEVVGLEDEYADQNEAYKAYNQFKKGDNTNIAIFVDPEEMVTIDRALGIAAAAITFDINHLRNMPNKMLAMARIGEKTKEYDKIMSLIEKKKF
jgi:hypothetical protein